MQYNKLKHCETTGTVEKGQWLQMWRKKGKQVEMKQEEV